MPNEPWPFGIECRPDVIGQVPLYYRKRGEPLRVVVLANYRYMFGRAPRIIELVRLAWSGPYVMHPIELLLWRRQ